MMRLMTLQQYVKMSKPALIRKITKALKKLPKKKLARLCYEITKAKLPSMTFGRAEYRGTGLEIVKEKGKGGYYQVKQADNPYGGMAYYREKTKKQAQKSLDHLIKKGVGTKKRKTKRKFSRKQLAAQRLFAKRARAGTLRRR